MNPYRGAHFFDVLFLLLRRLFDWARGNQSLSELASDEIQLLVLIGVSISSALIGSFLVFRRMAMLANSLSHTVLLGIVVAFLLLQRGALEHDGVFATLGIPTLVIAALFAGLLTTLLTALLTRYARLQEDAANGLVFSTLFAVGILLVSLFTRNLHLGAEVIMGNPDALHVADLKLVYIVLGVNLLTTLLFFRPFVVTTFDPGFARSLGWPSALISYILMAEVSLGAVSAFRAVGVLMLLAFLVAPILSARLLTHRLGSLLVIASLIGALASLFGVATARGVLSTYGLPLSTGGLVVCYLGLFYGASLATHFILKRVRVASPRSEELEGFPG